MSRGINKVILIGNLGKDPETRYMPNGGAVTNLTIATSDNWKDKQTGQMVDRTEWHKVVFFNRLGEIAGEYLKKGSKIYIEGRLQTRKWQDQNGQDRWSTEIVGNDLQMLDGKGDPHKPQEQSQPQQQSAQQSAPQNAPQAADGGGYDDFDDDIPF